MTSAPALCGFCRIQLEPASTAYAEFSIEDYGQRRTETEQTWQGMNGQQGGDLAKLAAALVTIAEQDQPPLRWVAGEDALAGAEKKAHDLLNQIDAYRDLSTHLAHNKAQATA